MTDPIGTAQLKKASLKLRTEPTIVVYDNVAGKPVTWAKGQYHEYAAAEPDSWGCDGCGDRETGSKLTANAHATICRAVRHHA